MFNIGVGFRGTKILAADLFHKETRPKKTLIAVSGASVQLLAERRT